MKTLKNTIQGLCHSFGYEINKMPRRLSGTRRPVGNMVCFLEDLAGRGFQPKHILDVGANEGNWSRLAAGVFPNANFVLIEPQSEMNPYLEKFCKEHPSTQKIEAGAGAEKGSLTLTVWDDFQGSSFLAASDPVTRGNKQTRTVEIVTIDSLYADPEKLPDLVKLDVQGFELEALKGAASLFGKTELFILEASLYKFLPDCPTFSSVVEFMSKRGYEVYDIPGFARRPYDGALGQIDLAFAQKDGFLMKCAEW